MILGILLFVAGTLTAIKFRFTRIDKRSMRLAYFSIALVLLASQFSESIISAAKHDYLKFQYTDIDMMSMLIVTIAGLFFFESLMRIVTPWAFIISMVTFFSPAQRDFISIISFTTLDNSVLLIFAFFSIITLDNYELRDVLNSLLLVGSFLVYDCVICELLGHFVSDSFYSYSTGMFHKPTGEYAFLFNNHIPNWLNISLLYLLGMFFSIFVLVVIVKYKNPIGFSKNIKSITKTKVAFPAPKPSLTTTMLISRRD